MNLNESQQEYGDKLTKNLAVEFNLSQSEIITLLNNIQKLKEFFNWVNSDVYIMDRINEEYKAKASLEKPRIPPKKFSIWFAQSKTTLIFKSAFMAKKLRDIVLSVVNRKITEAHLSAWMVDFHRMFVKDGIDPNEAREVLRWYKDNIGGEYVPVAHSGKAFREKYDKLLAAVARDSSPGTKNLMAKLDNAYMGTSEEWKMIKEMESRQKTVKKDSPK